MRLGTVAFAVLNIDRPTWQQSAACIGEPLNTFFPAPGEHQHVKRAKAICNRCPVIEQCATYALSFADRTLPGIWAGMTERDRARVLHTATPVRYRMRKPE